MRRILLAATAIATLHGGQVLAADVPVKAATPQRTDALFNWRGFYAGAHAGYGWGHADWTVTADGFGFLDPDGLPVDTKGALFGAQMGHNWQSGAWVYGLEADFSAAKLKGFSFTAPNGDGYQSRLTSFGTIRGRLGAVAGSTLWYVSAGAAHGRLKSRVGDIEGDLSFDPLDSASDSETKWGIAAGAGAEWAFAPNWTIRAEYLYVDLGKIRFSGTDPGNGNPVRAEIDTAFHAARAALNFRW
jgi:outer membrane immunogenic protein